MKGVFCIQEKVFEIDAYALIYNEEIIKKCKSAIETLENSGALDCLTLKELGEFYILSIVIEALDLIIEEQNDEAEDGEFLA